MRIKKCFGIFSVVLLICGFLGGVAQAQKTVVFMPGVYTPCEYKKDERRCYYFASEPMYVFEPDGTGTVSIGPLASLQRNEINWKQEGNTINVIFKKGYSSPRFDEEDMELILSFIEDDEDKALFINEGILVTTPIYMPGTKMTFTIQGEKLIKNNYGYLGYAPRANANTR